MSNFLCIIINSNNNGQYRSHLFYPTGLDDTTAARLNGFAMLQKLASGFHQKELATKLEKAMQYIKTKYQSHLTQNSVIVTYSTTLAVSDKKNELFISNTATTDEVCSNCFNLCKSLDDIGKLLKKIQLW